MAQSYTSIPAGMKVKYIVQLAVFLCFSGSIHASVCIGFINALCVLL